MTQWEEQRYYTLPPKCSYTSVTKVCIRYIGFTIPICIALDASIVQDVLFESVYS